MKKNDLKEYAFDSPLLVTERELVSLPAEAWQSGEHWAEALKERTDILGIVLPLEIKASGHHSRQDLLGLELLNWLRWSADEPLRYVPVLAVAWQPLEALLSRTLNLLLVTRGTTFVRLPEAVTALPRFVEGVRRKDASWPKVRPEDLERIAGNSRAEGISYHDLANEYYGAFRLWEGYKYALKEAKQSKELKHVEQMSISFSEEMQRKLSRPEVREYLASRRRQASPIYYPVVSDPNDLIRNHVTNGLPSDIRILMVDDEFEKGLAEALLKILFRASQFNFQLDGEWVYTEDNRARLVCVKSIREAACWLKHWGEMDLLDVLDLGDEVWRQWLGRWATKLGRHLSQTDIDEIEDISREVLGEGHTVAPTVDLPPTKRFKSSTVLLLDLHLDRREADALYDPRQMTSARLWRAIKEENEELPILIFTASRQAMNYSAIMEAAGPSDGWLTKEGPDITQGDNTQSDKCSSQAALYLLERLHMFSSRSGWYRPEFHWETAWIQEYAAARLSADWDKSQQHVAAEATRIYQNLHTLSDPTQPFLTNINALFMPTHFSLENKLVQRRVAVAALLETAVWDNNVPKANVDEFMGRLHCRPKKDPPMYVSDVQNFKELWFASYKPEKVVALLLQEEREWLLTQKWTANRKHILAYLKSVS